MKRPLSSEPTKGRRVIDGVDEHVVHVIQGEHHVSDDSGTVFVTILGSCVAACIRDPQANVGGMNHFLLPGDMDSRRSGEAERQAVHAMELLLNALLVRGASRGRLEAKLFGGACTMSGLADVGSRNAKFAVDFLHQENIEIVGQCLLGRSGRRVQYWPITGRARRSFINYENEQPMLNAPRAVPVVPANAGSLELF